jgi:hypothetical protein
MPVVSAPGKLKQENHEFEVSQGQPGLQSQTLSKKKEERKGRNWALWCTPIIPAIQEGDTGGLWFKAGPGKNEQDLISKTSWVWWCTPTIPIT